MKTNYRKNLLNCLMVGMLLFGMSACAQQTSPQSAQASSTQSSSTAPTPPQLSSSASNSDVAELSSSVASTPDVTPNEDTTVKADAGALVIYFSATGNTKAVAESIAETANGDLYEITPVEPYTDADLNWSNEASRVTVEHNDPAFRPAIAGELPDVSTYDTVFIGYPSWWGEAPTIVWTLMEGIDFAGKTVIPFCTSSSSGLGSSGETLEAMTSGATWLEGQRFRSGVDDADVAAWVKGLDI